MNQSGNNLNEEPVLEPEPDPLPNDKPAAKGVWWAIAAVLVISLIAMAVIYR